MYKRAVKILSDIADRVNRDTGNLQVLRDNAKIANHSILGKIVLFFKDNPDEHFTFDDIVIRFTDPDLESPTLIPNLKKGILSKLLTAKIVGPDLCFFRGPSIDHLKSPVINNKNKRGIDRLRTDTVMYDTLARLKEDPNLSLDTSTLPVSQGRFTTVFRFAINERLIDVYNHHGTRYCKATPKLLSTPFIQSTNSTVWTVLRRLQSYCEDNRPSRSKKFYISETQAKHLRSYLEQGLQKTQCSVPKETST